MKKNLLPILILCSSLLVCCTEYTYTPEFLTDSTIRLEVGEKKIFTFTKSDCQYAYNIERCEFRAHTDNMSDYFIFRLSSIPSHEGEEVQGLLVEWTERNSMNTVKKNIALQTVKIEDDTIWLWNSREGIKATLRFQ